LSAVRTFSPLGVNMFLRSLEVIVLC
jgi:hypothetical protein